MSLAIRHCQRGLAMLVAAAAEGTHESSEPSSAAFCSTVCAASGQLPNSSPRCAQGSSGCARHLPEVIMPARGGGLCWWWAQGALIDDADGSARYLRSSSTTKRAMNTCATAQGQALDGCVAADWRAPRRAV